MSERALSILQQAETALRTGAHAQSRKLYESLLADPDYAADARYGLGTVALHEGNATEALKYLRIASAALPTAAEVWFNLGLAADQLQLVEEARDAWTRALSLSADDQASVLRILKLLVRRGWVALAAANFDRFVPKNAAEVLQAAEIENAMGDREGAAQRLFRLAENPTTPAAVREALASAIGKIRDYPRACSLYKSLCDSSQLSADGRLKYAQLLLQSRDAKTAARQLKGLGVSRDVQLLQLRLASLDADKERVRSIASAIVATEPDCVPAHRHLLSATEDGPHLSSLIAHALALLAEPKLPPRDKADLALACAQARMRLGDLQSAVDLVRRGNTAHDTHLTACGKAFTDSRLEHEATGLAQQYGEDRETDFVLDPNAPVFIVGMPRSGTTLLEKIVGGLGAYVPGGESEALELIASQRNFRQRTQRTNSPLAESDEYWRLSQHDPGPRIDKMPHNFRHIGLIARLFPGARVLLMRRRAPDVMWSIYARLFPDDHNYATQLTNIARYCRYQEAVSEFWAARYPERIDTVQFEALVTDPEPVVRNLADRLSVAWDPSCLAIEERQSNSYTFSENQVKQAIHARGLDRWRRFAEWLPDLRQIYDEAKENPSWAPLL